MHACLDIPKNYSNFLSNYIIIFPNTTGNYALGRLERNEWKSGVLRTWTGWWSGTRDSGAAAAWRAPDWRRAAWWVSAARSRRPSGYDPWRRGAPRARARSGVATGPFAADPAQATDRTLRFLLILYCFLSANQTHLEEVEAVARDVLRPLDLLVSDQLDEVTHRGGLKRRRARHELVNYAAQRPDVRNWYWVKGTLFILHVIITIHFSYRFHNCNYKNIKWR